LVYNNQTFNPPNFFFKDRYMEKRRIVIISGHIITILCLVWFVLPVWAQVEQPGEEAAPEPLIRVVVKDVQVQGGQTPETVKESFNAILPQVVQCFEAEYERVKKLPNKLMLRFNVSSNGKVVWRKLSDPSLKSLDACLAKVLSHMEMPPTGSSITRVTVVLETTTDTLLSQ
jgi:hypothetical protein